MGDNDDDSARSATAIAAKPRLEQKESTEREPDISTERGRARSRAVIITETIDDPDGGGHVRHAGDDPGVHKRLLVERSLILRHQVTEVQQTKRQLAWAAVVALSVAALIFAFAPQALPTYLGAAFLLVAGGAFGIKSLRLKAKDLELETGDKGDRRGGRGR
jgi:hypothetical protein